MNTLTADEERYAISKIEEAIENPRKYGLDAASVEKLNQALERHKKHLQELEAADNE